MTLALKGSGIDQPALAPGVAGNGPAFSAWHSVAQSLTGADQKIIFGTEEYDTASCYDPVAGRFTPNVPGYYLVRFSTQVTAAATGLSVDIRKNGNVIAYASYMAGVNNPLSVGVELIWMNGTTDYMEVFANSSVAGSSVAGAGIGRFQAVLVRST